MFLFLSNTSLKKLELLNNIFQNEQPDLVCGITSLQIMKQTHNKNDLIKKPVAEEGIGLRR